MKSFFITSLLALNILGVALASTLNVKADQMAECWEAFSLNKGVSQLTDHTFQAYRLQLMKDSEACFDNSTPRGAVHTRSVKREASNMVTPPNSKRPNNRRTTTAAVQQTAMTSSSNGQAPKYESRTRVGEVVASFNPSKFEPISPGNKRLSCTITPSDENVLKPYRHMFTTLEDRAAALDAKLDELGEQIIEKHGIGKDNSGIAPLVEVNVPGHDKGCYVGRICNEVSMNLNNLDCCVVSFHENETIVTATP